MSNVGNERRPLVSLIVPMHLVAEYLPETIPTYLNQIYENVEIILVDDASPDDTGEIAEEFARKDDRVRVIHRAENGGLSAARNTGLEVAQGEYIALVDSDDTIVPEMVERCVGRMIETDADVGCFSLTRILPNGKRYEQGRGKPGVTDASGALKRWFRNDGVVTGAVSKIVKRGLISKNRIRFVEGEVNEDVMYTAAVLGTANRVVFCGEPLYEYRSREGSITKSYTPETIEVVIRHCDQLFEYVEERFPEIMSEYYFYRARVIWGSIIDPLSRKKMTQREREVRDKALQDMSMYAEGYDAFLDSIVLGKLKLWLLRHGLYRLVIL